MTHRTFLALTAATTVATSHVFAMEIPDLSETEILVTDFETFERVLIDVGASTELVSYLAEHPRTIVRAGDTYITFADGTVGIAVSDMSPEDQTHVRLFGDEIVNIADVGVADIDASVLTKTMDTLLAIAVKQATARAGVTVDLDELAAMRPHGMPNEPGPDDVALAARTNPPAKRSGARALIGDLGPALRRAAAHLQRRGGDVLNASFGHRGLLTA